MQIEKELFVAEYFLAPQGAIKALQLVELFFRKIQAMPFDVVVPGHPADWRFLTQGPAMSAISPL